MSDLPPSSPALARHIQDSNSKFSDRPLPCFHSPRGRIIVISADGTSNEFGEKSTNVVEFHSRVIKDDQQLTFYISGIGTYAVNKAQALLDMAFASTFERNVLAAYKWLAENYQDGDRIFLFGFSRGAYQVRVLAGMIERVGLLHKGNDNHISPAFKLYMATTEKSSISKMIFQKLGMGSRIQTHVDLGISATTMQDLGTPSEKSKELCSTFKKAFSREVKVHFVGVWDTVSSVGVTSGFNLPETADGMTHVCHFRQALALDERRVRFWPEYAGRFKHEDSKGTRADVKEVWFAGSHSDVGGGNVLNKDLTKFTPALRWMTYEAVMHGLRMKAYGSIGNALVNPRPDVRRPKGVWFLLELFPLLRPSAHPSDSIQRFRRTRRPHLGAPRRIFDGQRIHESALEAMRNAEWGYKPAAAFHSKTTKWPETSADDNDFKAKHVELDPIISAQSLVEDIKHLKRIEKDEDPGAKQIMSVLKGYAGSPMRIRSLAEVPGVVATLTDHILFPELDRQDPPPRTDMYSPIFSILESIPKATNNKIKVAEFRTHVSRLRRDTDIVKRCRNILIQHGDGQLSDHDCHPSEVLHVGFSSDPRSSSIFSVSATKVVILRTGMDQVENTTVEFLDHTKEVSSAALSSDGSHLVLGLLEAGIEAGELDRSFQVPTRKEQLAGANIRRVAFSPDGNMLVAALDDGTIKLWRDWKGAIGDIKTLEDHRGLIRSLVFSADGLYIISGSDDKTIRVWDVRRALTQKENFTDPLIIEGDGGLIRSVAIHKKTVGYPLVQWSLDTAQAAGRSLEYLTWPSYSGKPCTPGVATRPMPSHTPPRLGYLIAFGSDDGVVRIWDGTQQKMIQEMRGHSNWIYSVAISPNGEMIASASGDCTIRLWDVQCHETLAIYNVETPACTIAFSPDGKKLVTGNLIGRIQVWDADVIL